MQRVGDVVDGMLMRLAAERHARVTERHRKLLEDELAPTLAEWLVKFHVRYSRVHDLPRVVGGAPPADCIDPVIAMGMGHVYAAEIAERNLALVQERLKRCVALLNQRHWSYDGAWHMNLLIVQAGETAILIYARRVAEITTRPVPANDLIQVPA